MSRVAERLVGFVAAIWIVSLRLEVIESDALLGAAGRPRAFAFWHGQQFALLRWARGRALAALVSRSRDGGLIAAALACLGVRAVRGSSSRGGALGLRGLVRALRSGLEAAFAVDGPKGPRLAVRAERGRAGVALAAELARGVVVPLASASAHKIVFRSWDRFELPLPFTRVVVVLGAPIDPASATPDAIRLAVDAARAEAERHLAPRASVPAVDALLQVSRRHRA
jgi:lysophospholipid acyltransferase (LPLAT)-like uncharacterized protein